MTFQSDFHNLAERDLADYGFARARDAAFDAVMGLWKIRKAEGMQKKDIAALLGHDPSWVTRSMSGPGNWTLRTFGELVAAMSGDVEISVHPIESAPPIVENFHAYAEYPEPSYLEEITFDDDMTELTFSLLKIENFGLDTSTEDFDDNFDDENILTSEMA